jgi:hypothetical protein
MRERFVAFALSLHSDKTRLIEFGRHAAARRARFYYRDGKQSKEPSKTNRSKGQARPPCDMPRSGLMNARGNCSDNTTAPGTRSRPNARSRASPRSPPRSTSGPCRERSVSARGSRLAREW